MMKVTKLIFLSSLICWIFLGCLTIPLPDMKSRGTFLSGKNIGSATFSPDGNELVFSLGNKPFSNIYRVRVDGTGLVALTTGATCDFGPVFSPDGSKVLFSHISDGQGDLCVIRFNGSNKLCLTSGPEHDFEPVYSPDGSKIYFLRAQVFRNYSPIAAPAWHRVDIYSINADGTGLKRITFENAYGMSNLSINPMGDTLLIWSLTLQSWAPETGITLVRYG